MLRRPFLQTQTTFLLGFSSKRVLSHFLTPPNWRLVTMFSFLFPQHRLAGLHHDASIDNIHLSILMSSLSFTNHLENAGAQESFSTVSGFISYVSILACKLVSDEVRRRNQP